MHPPPPAAGRDVRANPYPAAVPSRRQDASRLRALATALVIQKVLPKLIDRKDQGAFSQPRPVHPSDEPLEPS